MVQRLIFKNASIYREDLSLKKVNLVVEDDKIVSIGAEDSHVQGRVIECDGMTIAKPFCDYHFHLPGSLLYDLFGVNLSECTTPEAYAEALKRSRNTDKIVRAFGWEVEPLRQYFENADKTPLQLIDELFPDKPAIIFSLDFHSCWCNSVALKMLQDDGIFCDFQDGEIPGGAECILHEKIAERIFQSKSLQFSESEIKTAILCQQEKLLALGITEIYSLMFIGASFSSVMNGLKSLDDEGLLCMSVHFALTVNPTDSIAEVKREIQRCFSYESKHLMFATVKIYMDGVIDNHSAFLLEPYADLAECGKGLWTQAQLKKLICCASEFDLPLHIHAIGDAAVERCACALSQYGQPKRGRHIVAHVQLCSESTAEKLAQSGVVACMQPFWFERGEQAIAVDIARLGARVACQYPVKTLLKKGVKVLFSSDCPASVSFDPILGMQIASSADDQERISVEDAYKAYYAGSYHEEGITLNEGDRATFILLSGDMLKNSSVRVIATVVDGKIEYQTI